MPIQAPPHVATTIELLAHRGLWRDRREGNSRAALQAALEAGYGLETDIRDRGEQLMVAHDPADERAWPLRDLLGIYAELRSTACLALNIKSDGLAPQLAALLEAHAIENYFVFDMSVPDMLHYARAGLRFFTRHSEYEPRPALYDQAAGVWLDAFHHTWFTRETIAGHVRAGKDVCVVSPELHSRQADEVWRMLAGCPDRGLSGSGSPRLMLCTDRAPAAEGMFQNASD